MDWPRHLIHRWRRLGWADWSTGAALAVIAVAAVLHSREYAGAVIDDAYITFRHALNLVRGHGLTCNPGERIEGTSSAFYALIMVVPIALGVDPYRAAALLGSLAFAGCSVSAYLAVRACIQDGYSRLLGVCAAALVAASPVLALHSQTGMETLPYCCLLAWGWWLHLRAVAGGRASSAWPLVLAAAGLMRPEGFAYFLLLWTAGGLARWRRQELWSLVRVELLPFLGVYVAWLLLRYAHFGSLVPNSVLAKSGHAARYAALSAGPALRRLLDGPGTLLLSEYARAHVFTSLFLIGALLLRRGRYAAVLAVGFALLSGAAIAWNDGDWMPYRRLLTPALVPFAVCVALGLRGFLFHREQRSFLGHVPSLVLGGLALVAVIGVGREHPSLTHTSLVDGVRLREMGQRLATLARPSDRVASEEGGVLVYYWGIPAVDMYGLCDAHIARRGNPQPLGAGRADPAYVIAKRPTFFVFDRIGRAAVYYQHPAFAPDRHAFFALRFPRDYLATYSVGGPPVLFVRKDRPNVSAVAQALGARLVDAGEELRRAALLH